MKRLSLIILAVFLCQMAKPQAPEQKKDSSGYRHEFGLDATSFIRQFLNLNFSGSQVSYPVYYLTYRLHSKNSNIRAGIGGEYNKKNAKPSSTSSPLREHDLTRSTYYRVGYERIKIISPKWNVFYGVDLRPSISYIKNDNTNQISGYTVGQISDSKTIGIAPLLGAKFQLNKRLSLSTEASLSFNYSETKTRNFYTPHSVFSPDKPEDNHRDTYTWYTLFNPPVFVIFAFDI